MLPFAAAQIVLDVALALLAAPAILRQLERGSTMERLVGTILAFTQAREMSEEQGAFWFEGGAAARPGRI